MCCCKLNRDGHPSPWLPAARGDPSPAAASRDALSLQQALHNQMITAVQEISNLIEPVASAARAEASQLGHKVTWGCQLLMRLSVCMEELMAGGEAQAARAGSCWR